MKRRRIVVASDHAGFALKEHLRLFLLRAGCAVVDVGTHDAKSCDYPDYAAAAARCVKAGEAELGVLVCGTGMGMSVAANKVPGIRAALCGSEFMAELARRHNDANIICLGGWIQGPRLAEVIVRRFLETDFEGGRHRRRVAKIRALERPAGKAQGP